MSHAAFYYGVNIFMSRDVNGVYYVYLISNAFSSYTANLVITRMTEAYTQTTYPMSMDACNIYGGVGASWIWTGAPELYNG